MVGEVPDLPGDGRAVRTTRQEVAYDEMALVARRLSAQEALELLRLWMGHVTTSSTSPALQISRHQRQPRGELPVAVAGFRPDM